MKGKSFAIMGLLLGMGMLLGTPGWAEGKEVKIQGEVVGLACLLSHGETARGESHKKCAIHCVEKGQPIGLLTEEGKVYVLYAGMTEFEPFESAKAHAGSRVEITGTVGKMGNLEGLTVAAVRPL